jgi:hypothetical protein
VAGTTPIILSEWYNFTTFDIIGDLAFGEPFGYLETSHGRTWFKTMFDATRFSAVLQALSFFPLLKAVLLTIVSKTSKAAYEEQKRQAKAKMMRRIEVGHERPDLIERLIQKKDEWVNRLCPLLFPRPLVLLTR